MTNTPQNVTIKHVAKRAGVSATTVSRVLNGHDSGHMHPQTKERVLVAIEELDYVPVRAAQRLRKQKTQVIALLLPDISNPFFSLLARGLESVAFEEDYSTFICDSNHSVEKESRYLDILLAEQVEGVVFVPVNQPNMEEVNRLLRRGIKVVVADRRIKGLPGVEVDNKAGSRELTEHLLHLGYREIAYIAGPREVSTACDRLAGFQETMERAHLNSVGVWNGNFTYESGYEQAKQILDSQNVDAIMAANDLMAVGGIQALEDHGMKIPQDIGITGFDDIPLASLTKPSLTTINTLPYKIGERSMEVFLELIKDDNEIQHDIERIKGELVIRDSC